MEKIKKLCEDKIQEPWEPSWAKFENEYLTGEKHFAEEILKIIHSSRKVRINEI